MFGPLAWSSTRLSRLARTGWCCVFPLFLALWVWKGSLWKHALFPCVFSVFWRVLKCVVWDLCVCVFLDVFICILFVNDVYVICFCSCASPLCFYIFSAKFTSQMSFLCFGECLNVWFGAMCVVFSCCFHVYFVCKWSLRHMLPLSHVLLCVFAVSTKLFSQLLWLLVLLCFGRWLNSHLGVIMCVCFSFVLILHSWILFCIRPRPYLPIPDHSCPLTLIPIPYTTYREFSRPYTHKTYVSAHHPYPQVPFLIVFPPQHTPTHPTHPSTPIANHNYIHIHYMRNM